MLLNIENIEKEDEETALNEPARLVEAAKDADKETAETLNKADAGLDAKDNNGRTALMPERDQEAVDLWADALNIEDALNKANIDLGAKDINEMTVSMPERDQEAVDLWADALNIEDALNKANIDLGAKDINEMTALAQEGRQETAEALNKADAVEDIFNEIPDWVQEGRQETTDVLNKADAVEDNNGRTALMRAEEHNRTEFMEMLHKAGEQKEAEKSSLLNTLRTLQAQSSEQTSPALEMKNPEKQQAESLLLQQIKNQAGR